MWKIGDKVKQGEEEATVIAIYDPIAYIDSATYKNATWSSWDKVDIFWRENLLLSLKYNKPRKLLTFEEFVDTNIYKNATKEELPILYKHTIAEHLYMTVPEKAVTKL